MTQTSYAPPPVSFPNFIDLWNKEQNMRTPRFHRKIAEWLERQFQRNARMLLMAFRSAGKSSLAGLFAAWLLKEDCDIRILVVAAEQTLAAKMVRQVKRIIERHPLTAHMKPKRADQWGSDRFTVERNLELRDPSMLARGISANITGARADVVLCDDVEVPNTSDSAAKREQLRHRLTELAFTLTAGGKMLYIGTPHHYNSIYADTPREELGEDSAFLDGFDRLIVPIEDEDGQIAWPEEYTREDIERIKKQTGPNKFASQMLLRPVNIAEGRLNPDYLHFYDGDMAYVKELKRLEIAGTPMVSASAYWDPAMANATDSSVLAVVYSDAEDNRYLHRLEYIALNPASKDDEATQQCRQIAFIAKALMLPSVTVETNGIGNMLPNILRREMRAENVACIVREKHNSRPKDLRILEGFDALMAARALHVHERVKATPFLSEMSEWRPELKNGRDDGLDAVAGALAQEPLRVRAAPSSNRQSWHSGSGSGTAKTDFDV